MSSGERQEGGRRSQSRNLMPVSVRMLLQHQEEEGPLQVCGVEVGLVVMVVQVRQVVNGDSCISYMVEDDSGRIEAMHYVEEGTVPAFRNTFVKIIGVLKSGREQNMVTVYRLSTIQDMNEVMAHQLQLVVTPLHIRRQQTMAASAAQASLTGISFHRQGGLVQMVPVPVQTGMAGDGRQLVQGRGGQQTHSWISQTFAQPSQPAAVLVLRSIKACMREVGISRKELQAIHRKDLGADMVDEMLENLTMEGHIYTTIDQHHYKSTDA